MIKLGVNIDHVATLRQARKEESPDPVLAAQICEQAGADSIVAHLREDRRHIQDQDVFKLRKIIKKRFNLEMSIQEKIINIALKVRPDQTTLVPEKREELTTEGGLDVCRNFSKIKKTVKALSQKGIAVSLFIDPDPEQIRRSKDIGVSMIEFHTGCYAKATNKKDVTRELKQLIKMTEHAHYLGLVVNAGHGLNYDNTRPIAQIPGITELNIGHAIVSQSVFVGLENAVKMMLHLIRRDVVKSSA